ncbi:hypothetical protein [Hymenobacter metallilatus]|uniref:STAS/SEC14 domain-containing protein n=1 Tax=Hymenobacter metallilatus TaxID=2493666 RepID=A0A428JMW7_9BACT|nr:hypothetical protein [Hymenobacter metallilatus]RSK34585.1 hypothetical protein EI290_08140 [Hymenobacter metallilatus]
MRSYLPGILHFTNSLGQVVHYPSDYVQLDWEVYPMAGSSFRDLLQQGRELCAQTGLHRLYTDHRGMPPVWVEDCAWITSEWLPQVAASAPGCRLALVETATILDSAGLRATVEQAEMLGVTVACFESEAPALNWLRAN